MKFEIEKLKDGTFTVRIKVNGKVTFSNNGLDTKQAAYKKLCGLYKGILNTVSIVGNVYKLKGKKAIEVKIFNYPDIIQVKEINC